MNDEQVMKLMDKLSELSERIARVETMLRERATELEEINCVLKQHNDRIAVLEQNRASMRDIIGFIGWAIAMVIAVWSVIAK